MVHIDFGMIFDQGVLLRVPETVPFRLTQNLVDGLGVLGTEGVFRRSCERVLTGLRENTDTLMMILDVVVHDPLFIWTQSVEQLLQHQQAQEEKDRHNKDEMSLASTVSEDHHEKEDQGDTQDNQPDGADASKDDFEIDKDAARVLLRIRQKLKGQEDVVSDALSVEGHVRQPVCISSVCCLVPLHFCVCV